MVHQEGGASNFPLLSLISLPISPTLAAYIYNDVSPSEARTGKIKQSQAQCTALIHSKDLWICERADSRKAPGRNFSNIVAAADLQVLQRQTAQRTTMQG